MAPVLQPHIHCTVSISAVVSRNYVQLCMKSCALDTTAPYTSRDRNACGVQLCVCSWSIAPHAVYSFVYVHVAGVLHFMQCTVVCMWLEYCISCVYVQNVARVLVLVYVCRRRMGLEI